MPVVRTQVHVDNLVENQKLQELAEKAQQIVDKNRGTIQHRCNARRQEYSLNTSRADKKTYQLDRLTLTHTILFDQEIIELDVYPDVNPVREEDFLCLMVLVVDTIYAIPMSQLKDPTKMGIVYSKKLSNLNLPLGDILYHRQYKFIGADIGFFLGLFDFSQDNVGVSGLRMTPIDGEVKFSEEINESGFTLCAINGSGQTVYLPRGKYRYQKNKVELVETFDFGGSGVPYAFDSSGTAYFTIGAFRQPSSPFYVNFYFQMGKGLTPNMANQLAEYVQSNMTSFAYENPNSSGGFFQYCQNQTYYLATAINGTVPSDTANIKGAFQNGWPQFDGPLTDLSMPFFCPVFSTGEGDKIDLQAYPVSASAQITYDVLTGEEQPGDLAQAYAQSPYLRDSIPCPYIAWNAGVGAWGSAVVTSQFTFSFDKINVNLTDEIRSLLSGNTAGFVPYFSAEVYAEFPTVGGPMYSYGYGSAFHATGLEDTNYPENYAYRGEDSEGGGFVWSLLPDKAGTIPDFTVNPLAHISNGVHYIQTVELSTYSSVTTRYVFCDGTDIHPVLQELGIGYPNLMAMDIPLSRIKKFT